VCWLNFVATPFTSEGSGQQGSSMSCSAPRLGGARPRQAARSWPHRRCTSSGRRCLSPLTPVLPRARNPSRVKAAAGGDWRRRPTGRPVTRCSPPLLSRTSCSQCSLSPFASTRRSTPVLAWSLRYCLEEWMAWTCSTERCKRCISPILLCSNLAFF
jgi:hypothetical protein